MVIAQQDFGGRRAPYAPISALEKFLERMRDRSVPEYVDHRFLRKMNVASNNEYSLLSALKFLAILDDRGRPSHAYRQLQRADSFQETLRHLVETAYAPVFEARVEQRSLDELIDFFRAESSPSQAKNAARFFLAVCRLAGIELHGPGPAAIAWTDQAAEATLDAPECAEGEAPAPEFGKRADRTDVVLAKTRLLEKLPPLAGTCSPEVYRDICVAFAQMVTSLDRG